MRALWTAASGMKAQQANVDTISNNIANINTTGYKKETAQFTTLLYQTIQQNSTNTDGTIKPVGIQAGLGVKNSAITTEFSQGLLAESNSKFDFGIQGNGFFMVQLDDGSIGYTRNGSFTVANGVNGKTLATSEGYPVLDTNGSPIVIDQAITNAISNVTSIDTSKLVVDDNGYLYYPDANNKSQPLGIQIGLAQFTNPSGLEKTSDSILKPTAASGDPIIEANSTVVAKSIIKQGMLESSNVQTVDEMVDLIVAQRAYEMNSKTINAADEMLQQANNIRR